MGRGVRTLTVQLLEAWSGTTRDIGESNSLGILEFVWYNKLRCGALMIVCNWHGGWV